MIERGHLLQALAVDLKEHARRPMGMRSRRYTSIRSSLTKVHELVSGHSGIITTIKYARFSAAFRPAHVYLVTLERMTLHSSRDLAPARSANPDRWSRDEIQGRTGHSLSTDREKAFVASFGEGIERYAQTLCYDPVACVTAAWRDAPGLMVDPRTFHVYSEDEYEAAPFFSPFAEDKPMRWTWAMDLGSGDWRLTPTQFSWLMYNRLPGEPCLKQGTSNGWAAHGTLEEAVLKCINENMERDSYVIMWHNRLSMPLVDLETVRHPRARELLDVFARIGATIRVVSTMTDARYPTFVAIATNDHAGYAPLTVTLGAGLDPELGILRSLEECLAAYILNTTFVRDGVPIPRKEDVVEMLDHYKYYLDRARRREVEWMWASKERVSVKDLPKHSSCDEDPLADVTKAVRILGNVGIRNYAIDTTPADIEEAGFKTAKVLSPQVCQVEFGSGLIGKRCERLYEVPVRLGYLDRPLRPDELNAGIHPHA